MKYALSGLQQSNSYLEEVLKTSPSIEKETTFDDDNISFLGYWDSLDELRTLYRSGKQWDPRSEPAERELLVNRRSVKK